MPRKSASPPKDDSLKSRRQREIIDATIETIYRRGIVDVRLADVARAAGVSYGVVSFYFKSKDALLLATMNHVAEEYSLTLRAAVEAQAASPMVRLLAMLDVNFDARVSEPRKTAVWVAIWGQSQATPGFRRRCCELQDDYVRIAQPICRAIVEAGGHRDIDPHEVAKLLCILMSGLDVEIHLRGRRHDVAAARRTCHALLAAIFPREYAAAVSAGRERRPVPPRGGQRSGTGRRTSPAARAERQTVSRS